MLIHAEGLTKTYTMGSTEVRALAAVDLQIDSGEYVAVVGRSGSGKSTLMHLLGCLDRPTAGRYRLDGQATEALDDVGLSKIRNQSIGFVFQSFNLIAQHDVLENVELPLIYAGIPAEERRERCLQVLEQVGLGNKTKHRPTELSGGEAQRVAIARAVAVRPPLLLADEPTGNLDSRTGDEIMNLFERLHEEGTTVILVTHTPEVAARVERLIEMKDGRILSDSSNGVQRRAANGGGARRMQPHEV
jgi:putative ABC transport system ATP-binding protein